ALADNAMDFVAIGHGLLADPHWANKVRSSKLDEIIPCIGCGECHYNSMNGKILSCAVTPTSGYEKEYALTPAAEDKKILVIGGGPGGMKAAITAAQRGFKVSLWEKNTYLGGEMTAAGAPRFKEDVMSHVEYLSRQVYKYPIDLKLGFTVTSEDVIKHNPDFVVVAAGAMPIVIRVPGYDKKHVVMAEEVLLKQRSTGEKIAVIGGGLVGCETAVELAMQGKDVTIVEMMDGILKTAAHFVANDQNLRYLVNESDLKIMTSTKLTEILDDGVVVEIDGKMRKVECDTVVFAVGFRSDQKLYNQIREAGFDAVVIGDNVRPGKIMHAIHQGYHAIRVL
ncbi:MAG: FAD-dependent oxidoreductase, partial [Bacillota bacterium]